MGPGNEAIFADLLTFAGSLPAHFLKLVVNLVSYKKCALPKIISLAGQTLTWEGESLVEFPSGFCVAYSAAGNVMKWG